MPDSARFPPNRACSPDQLGRLPPGRRPFFCPGRTARSATCRSPVPGQVARFSPSPADAGEDIGRAVLYFLIKAVLSGLIVAAVSEIARRYPGWGGLVASLPLTSLLAVMWLWRDSGDSERVAELATSTFWFVLPSLPLFIILQWLLRSGLGFWAGIAISVAVTLALYAGWFWAAPRLGIRL